MLSQNRELVSNARPRRAAISGVTALSPRMMACTFCRDVPMWSANASIVRPRASMLRLTITPGWMGRKPGASPAMVVLHFHTHGFAVFPFEHEAVVGADLDRILPGSVARQGMEGVAGLIQIFWPRCRIEHG